MAIVRICSVDGCGKPCKSRERCAAHHWRWRKHGDPLGGRSTERGDLPAFLVKALVAETDDCIFWPYTRGSNGYGIIRIDGRRKVVSRIVCERAHGDPPTLKHQAAHSCGRGHEGCINPRHLRWATRIENEADKLIHGTHRRGQRQHSAKLTEFDVIDIRRRAAAGETQRAIASEFGVGQQTVSGIVRREKWAWL